MGMNVAVLGATGVYGRHLLPRLICAGHRVRALVRSPEKATQASACGVEIRQADIFDAASLRSALEGCDIAINLATMLPSPGRQGGDYAENDRLRVQGTPIFLEACRASGVPRVLQQSVALIHAGGGETWADEETFHPIVADGAAGPAIAALRSMEASVRQSGLDWVILRGGLFYGPGTGFDDDWFSRAHAGKLRLPGDGVDYVSLVHITDMAAATVAAIAKWPTREAFIVADDAPARWRDVLGYVASVARVDPPPPGGRSAMPSFRVSNRKARERLSWSPAYADYRAGLVR